MFAVQFLLAYCARFCPAWLAGGLNSVNHPARLKPTMCPHPPPPLLLLLLFQITFRALYHLLDFGSGYDALLRASSAKRGWKETMQYGCFGLALAAKRWVFQTFSDPSSLWKCKAELVLLLQLVAWQPWVEPLLQGCS